MPDGTEVFENVKNNQDCTAFWRTLAANAVTLSASDPSRRVENFTVDGIGPVCCDFWGAAYGIREGTWKQIRSDARAQRLQADAEWGAAGKKVDKEFSTAAKEVCNACAFASA
eukprot:718008-Pleurochrysis_carterae.AAC.2